MLSNYLKLSVRYLKTNKGYFLINLLGLTIGIASFILIVLWIRTELSYDKFHENADRIYRVDYRLYEEGVLEQHSASGSGAIGREMKNAFPEVMDYTRCTRTEAMVRYGDKIFKEKNIIYAQSSFFSLFSFQLVKGTADTSLLAINNAVITEETARKYFGSDDPIGKMLKIDGNMDFMVRGIAKDPPENSHLKFDILLSYENLIRVSRSWDNSWVGERVYSYVLLNPGTDAKALEAKLPSIPEAFIGKFMKDAFFLLEYKLVKLTDIHLHSSVSNELEVNGNYRNIVTLGLVALLVLLIAFINYINLATSRSLERAHEVGIRKVTGAVKKDLVFQFLTESALLNIFALAISLVAMIIFLPFFRQVMDSPLKMDYLLAGILFITILITGTMLTGLFPAIYISRFAPGLVLKGKHPTASKWISRLKNYLVVFQFAISVVLITCTIIIFRQINYMQHHNTGFTMDGLVIIEGPRIINANTYEEYVKGRESFMNDISSLSTVSGITSTSCIPGMEIKYSRVFGVPVDGRNTEKKIELYNIDNRFFSTYGMKILAGEDFAVSPQEDMNKIIVNEAALEYYGYPDPEKSVGKILRGGKQEVVIKAVISDFNQQSLRVLPRPLAFFNQPSNAYYSVRIRQGASDTFIPELEKIWLNHYQGNPVNYFFLGDFYAEQYLSDKRFSALILAASILAIIIACLGLSGLSSYSISRRTKEIGIRKSNGAKTGQIMFLLNLDFVKWVFASIVIAIPLALFAMDNWLRNYAYRREIQWWIFLVSGLMAILIAIVTVGWQSWRASSGNPVDALRYE